MWQKIKYHPFFIRLFNWEYWPLYVSNIPVFFFWLIHAIRARDPFFFTTVNPVIPTGGLFGEEKHKIYDLIPKDFLPKTLFIPPEKIHRILDEINTAEMTYPLVCKPNVGERGMHVKVIESPETLVEHVKRLTGGIIVQEYIRYPLELSIMCHRFPISGQRGVTSVCRKAFLTITGDGRSTLSQLIDLNPRAILQKRALGRRMDLSIVPAEGESVLLEAIGNHCRGTKFLNANDWITPQLESSILSILAQMPGVHYGRFDLRTASIEDLNACREFLIMEFNGVGGEPAHIYDPGYPLLHAYKDVWKHWKILYSISREQKASGVSSMRFREGLASLRSYFSYKKKASFNYGI
jgi:hypothetical protein